MANGLKTFFSRLDRGTRVGPGLPTMPTHESMLLDHIRRDEAEGLRNRTWERRFHH